MSYMYYVQAIRSMSIMRYQRNYLSHSLAIDIISHRISHCPVNRLLLTSGYHFLSSLHYQLIPINVVYVGGSIYTAVPIPIYFIIHDWNSDCHLHIKKTFARADFALPSSEPGGGCVYLHSFICLSAGELE